MLKTFAILFLTNALLVVNTLAHSVDSNNIRAEITPSSGENLKIILVDKTTGKELSPEQQKTYSIKYCLFNAQPTQNNLLAQTTRQFMPYTSPIQVLESPDVNTASSSPANIAATTPDKGITIQLTNLKTGKLSTFHFPSIWKFLSKEILENYKRVTEQSIISNTDKAKEWDVYEHYTPASYGFPTSIKLEIPSTNNVKLIAWYIPARNKNSRKTLLLIHGRTSNHLKPMRYLEIVKKYNINQYYNIFLVDLRNSGESTPTSTYFGYKFSDDILQCLEYLSNDFFRQNNFIIMGSSQGGMGAAYAWYRIETADTDSKYANLKGKIKRIILDCPLSNVKETINYGAKYGSKWYEKVLGKLVGPTVKYGFAKDLKDKFNVDINNMCLSFLFKNIDIPVLIQDSKQDQTTPYCVLKKEHANLTNNKKILWKIFDNGTHVKVYEANKTEYTNNVRDFILGINNNSIASLRGIGVNLSC